MEKRTCSIDGCERPVKTHGWCGTHYQRVLRHGDPTITHNLVGEPDAVRFWIKVDKDGPVPAYAPHLGPCWLWTGSRNDEGYGNFWHAEERRVIRAHRWIYEHLVAPIADGLMLDHLCRVTSCVNPTHLEPVTNGENIRRGDHWARRITHCPKGHEFTVENTMYEKRGNGVKRRCRECQRARCRRYYYRKKA